MTPRPSRRRRFRLALITLFLILLALIAWLSTNDGHRWILNRWCLDHGVELSDGIIHWSFGGELEIRNGVLKPSADDSRWDLTWDRMSTRVDWSEFLLRGRPPAALLFESPLLLATPHSLQSSFAALHNDLPSAIDVKGGRIHIASTSSSIRSLEISWPLDLGLMRKITADLADDSGRGHLELVLGSHDLQGPFSNMERVLKSFQLEADGLDIAPFSPWLSTQLPIRDISGRLAARCQYIMEDGGRTLVDGYMRLSQPRIRGGPFQDHGLQGSIWQCRGDLSFDLIKQTSSIQSFQLDFPGGGITLKGEAAFTEEGFLGRIESTLGITCLSLSRSLRDFIPSDALFGGIIKANGVLQGDKGPARFDVDVEWKNATYSDPAISRDAFSMPLTSLRALGELSLESHWMSMDSVSIQMTPGLNGQVVGFLDWSSNEEKRPKAEFQGDFQGELAPFSALLLTPIVPHSGIRGSFKSHALVRFDGDGSALDLSSSIEGFGFDEPDVPLRLSSDSVKVLLRSEEMSSIKGISATLTMPIQGIRIDDKSIADSLESAFSTEAWVWRRSDGSVQFDVQPAPAEMLGLVEIPRATLNWRTESKGTQGFHLRLVRPETEDFVEANIVPIGFDGESSPR